MKLYGELDMTDSGNFFSTLYEVESGKHTKVTVNPMIKDAQHVMCITLEAEGVCANLLSASLKDGILRNFSHIFSEVPTETTEKINCTKCEGTGKLKISRDNKQFDARCGYCHGAGKK